MKVVKKTIVKTNPNYFVELHSDTLWYLPYEVKRKHVILSENTSLFIAPKNRAFFKTFFFKEKFELILFILGWLRRKTFQISQFAN